METIVCKIIQCFKIRKVCGEDWEQSTVLISGMQVAGISQAEINGQMFTEKINILK